MGLRGFLRRLGGIGCLMMRVEIVFIITYSIFIALNDVVFGVSPISSVSKMSYLT